MIALNENLGPSRSSLTLEPLDGVLFIRCPGGSAAFGFLPNPYDTGIPCSSISSLSVQGSPDKDYAVVDLYEAPALDFVALWGLLVRAMIRT